MPYKCTLSLLPINNGARQEPAIVQRIQCNELLNPVRFRLEPGCPRRLDVSERFGAPIAKLKPRSYGLHVERSGS